MEQELIKEKLAEIKFRIGNLSLGCNVHNTLQVLQGSCQIFLEPTFSSVAFCLTTSSTGAMQQSIRQSQNVQIESDCFGTLITGQLQKSLAETQKSRRSGQIRPSQAFSAHLLLLAWAAAPAACGHLQAELTSLFPGAVTQNQGTPCTSWFMNFSYKDLRQEPTARTHFKDWKVKQWSRYHWYKKLNHRS